MIRFRRNPRAAAVFAAAALVLVAAWPLAAEPQSMPTPASVDPTKPLTPSALKGAMTAWNGKEVSVGGHLWLFMGSEKAIDRDLELAPTPDAGKDGALVKCTSFAVQPEGVLRRADPLVVRGVVEQAHPYYKKVLMKDCTVVSTDQPIDESAAADPTGPTERVVPVARLHAAAFGWTGVEVAVVGRYKGSTYSSASDTTRHDLRDDQGAEVGCEQAGRQEAPKGAVDQREGVIVRGKVSAEMAFGSPQLEDCVWVNR